MNQASMPRFMLFAGDNHYPFGGWDDARGGFNSPDDAFDYLKYGFLPEWSWEPTETDRRWWPWAHVVDLQSRRIVRRYAGNGRDANYRELPATDGGNP